MSVAYAAVDLARHIFADLHQCNALLVGAGETIELVARHLIEAGKRDRHRQPHLGRAVNWRRNSAPRRYCWRRFPAQLLDADIVITSTASQLPILGKGAVGTGGESAQAPAHVDGGHRCAAGY